MLGEMNIYMVLIKNIFQYLFNLKICNKRVRQKKVFTRIYSQRRTVRAPPSFFTRARDIIWGRIRRRVGFTLLAFHLTIHLSLSPLYPFLSLSFPLSIPLSLSFSPSLYLSLLSLPPSLYLFFYLSFSLFPSLSLLFIILFGVSNECFRPCFKVNTYIFEISILSTENMPPILLKL